MIPADSKDKILPEQPDWVDRLLKKPWTTEASLQVDRWLWYVEREFEGVE